MTVDDRAPHRFRRDVRTHLTSERPKGAEDVVLRPTTPSFPCPR